MITLPFPRRTMIAPAPRRFLTFTMSATIATTLAACGTTTINDSHARIGSAPYIEGSGKMTTDTRQLGQFHALLVDTAISATVTIGSATSVAVTADDNLVGLILTEVQDGKLSIRINASLETRNDLKVLVTTPVLDSVAATDGSTLDYENASAAELTVAVDNGSTVRAGGRVSSLILSVGNGSTGDLRNLSSDRASASVDNGSTARVKASQAVGGSCHNGSTLLVGGGAQISVESDISSTVKAE
jgi:hypothetical protein